MAVQVGTLVVQLEARVARLERGLRQGNRAVKGFEAKTNRTLRRIGRGFARLGRRVLGLGALLGAAAGAFSAAAIIRGAIDAASAVDSYRIRLEFLIGSQIQANNAIGNLIGFAQRVAPSLKDIIEAAATLGTVALGSARKIDTLTRTAANIAAVTGLTLTQSAQNLQRALSAGIGAADLFRERGVRAVVEALTGVSNLIAVPLEDVDRLMRQVFGPRGTFGEAAEAFAVTLPGAISRAGDALFKFSAALGEAITPAVIGIINKIIEALGWLERQVEDNEDRISEFARRGLIAAVKAIGFFAKAVVSSVKAWINFRQGLRAVQIALFKLTVFLTRTAPIIGLVLGGPLGLAAGLALRAAVNIEEMKEAIKVAEAEAVEAGISVEKWNTELDDLNSTIDTVIDTASDLGKAGVAAMNEAEQAAAQTLAALRQQLAVARPAVDPRTLREVEAAIARQTKMLDQRRQAEIEAGEPIQGRILALQQEGQQLEENLAKTTAGIMRIQAVLTQTREQHAVVTGELAAQEALLAVGTGDVKEIEEKIAVLKEEEEFLTRRTAALLKEIKQDEEGLVTIRQRSAKALKDISAEQERLATKQTNLENVRASAMTRLFSMLQTLKAIDEERQIALANEVRTRLEAASGVEEQAEVLLDLMSKVGDEIKKGTEAAAPKFSETIGGALSSGIGDALMSVVRGEGFNFAQLLSSTAGDLMQESFNRVLKDLGTKLNEILDDAFSGIGGAGLGGALSAAAGFALMFISSAMESTEASTRRARISDQAVESVEATRGIVVGPTEVPIFQVGNAIADAFIPVEGLLRETNDILRDIRSGGGIVGTTAGVVEFDLEDALEEGLNSSPALG
jgi:hypothetical protein